MDVKTICLGVLTFGDMAGYDIKKYFEAAFSHFYVAGFGSIYPALARLTEEGLVTVTSVEQEKRPAKKVYAITAAGREALQGVLMETAPRHKVRSEFLVLMYFAHLLPPQRLAEVVAQRLAEWEAVLEELRGYERCLEEQGGVAPGVRFSLGYGLAVIGAAVQYIRAHGPALLAADQRFTPGTSCAVPGKDPRETP